MVCVSLTSHDNCLSLCFFFSTIRRAAAFSNRFNYRRMSFASSYLFYKSVSWAVPLFLYAFWNGERLLPFTPTLPGRMSPFLFYACRIGYRVVSRGSYTHKRTRCISQWEAECRFFYLAAAAAKCSRDWVCVRCDREQADGLAPNIMLSLETVTFLLGAACLELHFTLSRRHALCSKPYRRRPNGRGKLFECAPNFPNVSLPSDANRPTGRFMYTAAYQRGFNHAAKFSASIVHDGVPDNRWAGRSLSWHDAVQIGSFILPWGVSHFMETPPPLRKEARMAVPY